MWRNFKTKPSRKIIFQLTRVISLRLNEAGAVFIKRQVDSLEELTKEYDLIMNCTGLGAKVLCKDRKMVPVKGQVIKVNFPLLSMLVAQNK